MADVNEAERVETLQRYNILDTAPETEFENIISLVQTTFNVPMAAISFIDSDRQWFKASRGLELSETSREDAFCNYTIQSDEVLVVSDAKEDDRFSDNPFVLGEAGIQCYMGTPLQAPNGKNIGSLCVIGTEPREFTEAEARILERFASLVVSQLELRQTALLDNLTQTMNRGPFLEQVDIAIKAFKQKGICSTLALIDVDRFKILNDTYGHPLGDKILVAFAKACTDSIRSVDLVGRIGGDEFGLLLRGITPVAADKVIQRVHSNISKVTIPDNPSVKITASIGYVSIVDSIEKKENWIELADIALYKSKANGRNVVTGDQVH